MKFFFLFAIYSSMAFGIIIEGKVKKFESTFDESYFLVSKEMATYELPVFLHGPLIALEEITVKIQAEEVLEVRCAFYPCANYFIDGVNSILLNSKQDNEEVLKECFLQADMFVAQGAVITYGHLSMEIVFARPR